MDENVIKIYIQESGSLARIVKNFELYKGQYIDYKIDIYVPITLNPTEEGHIVGVKTALLITKPNGDQNTTIGYSAYLKEQGVVEFGKTYDVYEQDLPRTFVLYGGEQTLIANIDEIDNSDPEAPEFVEIITTQTCPLIVQNSEFIENEEIPDPSQLAILEAQVNNLYSIKQDKDPEAPNEVIYQNGTWQDSSTVVGAINNNTVQTDANKTQIATNTGNIATNTNDIGDIKAEQITQNANIQANTNDINGVGGEPGLKQKVANLEAIVGTGEDYIGTYTNTYNTTTDLATLKTALNNYVYSVRGEQPEGGDVVIYVQQISGATDKNFKFIYSGAESDWTFYEIPATESATNNTKGILQGSYNADDTTKKTQVNVVAGEIEDVYVIDNDSNHRRIAEYLNATNTSLGNLSSSVATNTENIGTLSNTVGALDTQIDNILDGTTAVAKSVSATNDKNGNDIVNTYLTQTAGVTKVQLREYALPRAFNDVSYLTSTGYSDTIPTSASPIYSVTSEDVGDTELFSAEKTIVNASFQLSEKNSTQDVFYVSASDLCTVQFRLTTEIYKNSWVTASVELSDNVIYTQANEIKKLQFGSTLARLSEVVSLTDNDKIRQTLEVITNVSTSLTFDVYSNETYPSTFYLNTTSQTIVVAQGRLGQLPTLAITGTYNDVDDVITFDIPEGFAITDDVQALFVLELPNNNGLNDNTSIAITQGIQTIDFYIPSNIDTANSVTLKDLHSVANSDNSYLAFTGVFDVTNGDISLLADVDNLGYLETAIAGKQDVGEAVLFTEAQTLTEEQKAQARSNIGAGSSSATGNYPDLSNLPTLDTTQTTAQTTSASETITGSVKLHKISKTGTLADAIDDSTHRLVTDTQISTWGGKQDLIDSSHKLSADLVSDTGTTNKFVTSTDITNWNGKQDALSQTQLDAVNSGIDSTKVGQITTNANNISTIDGKIPAQASTSNQLADKSFVNSSIATNTANFIGTFADIPTLNAYSGTITNNDYAFVMNSVIEDNGNDWATFNDLNAYDKTLLTNFDYAWVVNGSNFDLYRFDIENQTWGLRVQNTAKASVTLNTAYNRYKANVSGGTTTWLFEYTLNNSSFTANQWAAINSGITDTAVAQISTNASNISGKMDMNNPTGTGKLSLNRLSGSTTGAYSGTVGKDNTASGTSSFAEGELNTADGSYSHAEGYQTYAGGFYSHTEGYQTYTAAHYSHAEGNNAEARGYSSHAEGYATTANNKSQHVFGEWNVIDNTGSASSRGTYVEIVGNGTASNNRSNARTLDWSGNEVLAGGLKIASTLDVVGADDVVSTTNVTPLANYYTKSETYTKSEIYTKNETDSDFAKIDASNLSSANVSSWRNKLQIATFDALWTGNKTTTGDVNISSMSGYKFIVARFKLPLTNPEYGEQWISKELLDTLTSSSTRWGVANNSEAQNRYINIYKVSDTKLNIVAIGNNSLQGIYGVK